MKSSYRVSLETDEGVNVGTFDFYDESLENVEKWVQNRFSSKRFSDLIITIEKLYSAYGRGRY